MASAFEIMVECEKDNGYNSARYMDSIKQRRGRDSLGCRLRIAHTTSFSQIFVLAVVALATLCSFADAHVARRPVDRTGIRVERREVDPVDHVLFEARGDRRQPHVGPAILARQDLLDNNQDGGRTTTTKATPSSTASSSTPTTSDSEPAPTDTTLPRAFDSNMGNNFTSPSCPNFIDTFKDSNEFNNCLPISLLVGNSQSFFQATASKKSLRRILDTSCGVVFSHCKDIMDRLASQIREEANCGADLRLGNPLAVGAYVGFQAYEPLFHASCLKASSKGPSGAVSSDSTSSGSSSSSSNDDDNDTSGDDYCYVDSTSVSAEPADNYIYSLPIGVPLPGASRPTCSPCLKKTMEFFAVAAQNMSVPLSNTYSPAALQVNNGCGPNWVNATVTPLAGSGGDGENNSGRLMASSVLSLGVAVVVTFWQILL